MDNIFLAPKNIQGRLYVPVKPLAEALGIYLEDYSDKSYLYLQGEMFSVALIDGMGYMESDKEGKREVSLNIFYQENMTWVPLRAFAELLGFYVEYRDGFAVIDDRLTAKKVIEDENIFSSIRAEFAQYIPNSKKTEGKTYHVAQTAQASDENSGTEKYPFKTLDKAAYEAKAGDTVIIHEGTYREVLAPKNDGTVYAPIIFKAAEGENVTISALEPLTNFVKADGNIYCGSYPKDLGFGMNQLFYKGEYLIEGRHPNEDTHPAYGPYPEELPAVWPTKGHIRITQPNGGNIAYSDTDLNQTEKDYWKGGTFVTLKGEGWSLASGDITGSSYGQLTLTDHPGSKGFNLGIVPNYPGAIQYYLHTHPDTDYGYITNHLNTVDMPGEWYAKDNKMYLYPPTGADLKKDFEIKQRQLCIDLRNRQYVTVQGINTIGGSTTMSGDNTEGCVLDGGSHKYITHHTRLIGTKYPANTSEETMESMQTIKKGEGGIVLEGKMNSVINTKIDYSSNCGILLLDRYHYVHNNIVSNTAYGGGYMGGIQVIADESVPDLTKELFGGHFITNNTIYNTGRAGLGIDGQQVGIYPCELAYNRVYNGALTTRDTGVYYEYGVTAGTDKNRTKLHHNYIYNAGHWDKDTGVMLMVLYHDGLVANRDTYSNIAFQTYSEIKADTIFVQLPQYTIVRCRNNSELGAIPGGLDGLKVSDFPGGRPFFAGSFNDGRERYMTNYEMFKAEDEAYYPDNHTVDSADNKETYRFENIEIPQDKLMQLSVYLKREINKAKFFDIKVRAYDQNGNLVKEHKNQNSFQATRFYIDEYYKGFALLPKMDAGTYDIELELEGNYTDVMRMRVDEAPVIYDLMFRDDMIIGGSWDDYDNGTTPGGERLPLGSTCFYTDDRIELGRWWEAGDCWDHTIYYRDRKVTGGDTLNVTYSTGTPYAGSIATVYVNSLDSEPIATYVTENTSWAPKEISVPLNRPLEDGTYTFIIKYEGKSLCSTLYNFSFSDSTATSDVAEN